MNDQKKDTNSIKDDKIQISFKLIPESLANDIKQELKQYVETLAQQDADLEKIEEYVSKINSDDIISQYYGLNRCRKLLSDTIVAQPIESLIQKVLQTNIQYNLFSIVKLNSIPLLKYEALWIISNIVFGTQEQIQIILDNDGINILFLALESQYDELIELGIWSLANIAADNIKFRDMLLQQGILFHLKRIWKQYKNTKSELIKTIVWALSNLAKGKPTTKFRIRELIQILSEIIISTNDEEQLIDSSWSLSYLIQNIYEIDMQIDKRLIKKLKLLLNSTKHTLIIPALKNIGNILSGNDEQTNQVLQAGVLQSFEILLQHKRKSIRREVYWSLSNIVAGTIPQIKQIIRNDQLLKSLFKQLKLSDLQITKYIAFFVSNSAIYAELIDLEYLIVNYEFIQKLSWLLDKNDEQIIQATLEGICKLIQKLQFEGKFAMYKQLIEDQKIIAKVIQLQSHPNETIYENALKILDNLVTQESI
ncbi:unnamed protein product [Paramecium primaurelia]|uniref:Importin subunit alpha n=1 Tax=Paramecium primaurelia TaxID=5886 RepID=A0A8S1NER9_PARPR|nr:unnamed protein product [Paramecium primaurelia]